MRIVLLAALIATPLAAQAASTASLLLGAGLSVHSPCARQVTITPDPLLHGMAAIRATADHQEEIDRLVMESHDKVEIATRPGGCWQPGLRSKPTMDIAIRVPLAYPLDIAESGAGAYTAGAVAGPLNLNISGAADMAAADAAKLTIDISGTGSVAVARAAGPAEVNISGMGRVTLAQAALPELATDLSGAGALAVTAGTIGKLSITNSGAGSITIGGTVGDADVNISGLGSVHIAHVSGSLQKEVSGLGSVTVGN